MHLHPLEVNLILSCMEFLSHELSCAELLSHVELLTREEMALHKTISAQLRTHIYTVHIIHTYLYRGPV